MERYLGLDVHAASCTLAVISEAGRRLKDFPVETNGQALVEAIRMIPGRKHLVFEEGLQSAWLYEATAAAIGYQAVRGEAKTKAHGVPRFRGTGGLGVGADGGNAVDWPDIEERFFVASATLHWRVAKSWT